MVPDCRVIVTDFIAVCELLEPLDFDGFCAGYLAHSTWLSLREPAAGPAVAVMTSGRGELRQRASYAA
jgi:hypothetical protein